MNNYVSLKELDEIAEELIKSFLGKDKDCFCIDIDRFATEYLGLTIEYVNFAEDDLRKTGFMEKENQEELGIQSRAQIDGYTDFIFVNRFGDVQFYGTLNKAIKRIIRDCNDEQFEKSEEPDVLLPNFSCHSLRHTFTTRMCEAGVNIKVIQDALGHKDITTTLNIYTDVTKELKKEEFEGLDEFFKDNSLI